MLRGISVSIDMDDRIALLGANGNGKSTLARLFAGRLEPMAGELRLGPRLRSGYFAQHQVDELVADETSLAYMRRALPRATETQVRSQLARFGLDADRAGTPVDSLSGGERSAVEAQLADPAIYAPGRSAEIAAADARLAAIAKEAAHAEADWLAAEQELQATG